MAVASGEPRVIAEPTLEVTGLLPLSDEIATIEGVGRAKPDQEDDSGVRDRVATHGLAIFRRIAINVMRRDRTSRFSMRARRKQAAWNDGHMSSLLAG
jgi:hypothetical protein